MSSWIERAIEACAPALRENLRRAMAEQLRGPGNTISPTAPIRVAEKPPTQPAMPPIGRGLREDHGVTNLDDLVTWLREQIEADRRDALMAAGPIGHTWTWDEASRQIKDAHGADHLRLTLDDVQCGGHIARQDPAQALAQCEAHTALLDALWMAGQVDEMYGEEGDLIAGGAEAINNAVRIVALAYQHRPGYREEWRP